jgi:hypothetical protein
MGAAHACLGVLTFFPLFEEGFGVVALSQGQVALVRNRSLPSSEAAPVAVKGGPAGPSEASREAVPLTGDGGAELRRFAGSDRSRAVVEGPQKG